MSPPEVRFDWKPIVTVSRVQLPSALRAATRPAVVPAVVLPAKMRTSPVPSREAAQGALPPDARPVSEKTQLPDAFVAC